MEYGKMTLQKVKQKPNRYSFKEKYDFWDEIGGNKQKRRHFLFFFDYTKKLFLSFSLFLPFLLPVNVPYCVPWLSLLEKGEKE